MSLNASFVLFVFLFQVRVAVFAKGEAAEAATAAGADIVGAEDLVASVMEGKRRYRSSSRRTRRCSRKHQQQ